MACTESRSSPALRGLRELVEMNHDEVLRRLEERDGLPPIVEALEAYEVEEDCECNCLACRCRKEGM